MDHIMNCMVCGENLIYTKEDQKVVCEICKGEFLSNAYCEKGHYICDTCHNKQGVDYALEYCLHSEETNPLELFSKIIKGPGVHLHGPEHHVIIPLVMLTAYLNETGRQELKEKKLKIAYVRGKSVPGGICGNYGSCGAAVGIGLFFSVLEGASPLSKESWGLANTATGQVLVELGKIGGPRCCKRNGFISILVASRLIKEVYGLDLLKGKDKPVCSFKAMNRDTCLKSECPFFFNT